MATHKKHKKAHHMRRNAAAPPARSVPRAVVVRSPRGPIASDLAAADKHNDDDTRGWRMIKALGGAAATTVAGAYLARQDVLSPKLMTGVISGLGAALAWGAPNKTVRSVGLGAMAAAGGQLGFMLIDDELIRREETKKKDDRPQLASGPHSTVPPSAGKKQSNASDIPADALARAYERARLKMALASEPPN
jgi:hypothetical protein